MEINKLNFEQFKSDRIVNSFEDLDVNSNGKIDAADKTDTNDINIFNQISYLLNSVDEADDIELVDDFDENDNKAGTSKDCSDGSCEATLPAGSTNDCPNGDCSVSAPSTNNNRVYNTDGSYSETTTNSSGQTIVKNFDATGKRISQKITNKDGSVVNYTFAYNNDGSYTQTAVYSDKTRVTKFNSAGKRISYTETYKNGTKITATFKYNENGSYSIIIKNQKTGTVATKKYNSSGKITSSVSKSKKDIFGSRTVKKSVYTYNSDGSYKKVYSNSKSGKVSVTNYDANGNKLKAGESTNVVADADSSNYKDKLNKNGVTFVMFTSPHCGNCKWLESTLTSVLPATEGLANFAKINVYNDNNNVLENNSNLLWSFVKKYKGNNMDSIGLPCVVKFVNGEPAGIVKFSVSNSAKLLDQIKNACKNANTKTSTANNSTGTSNTTSTSNSTATTNNTNTPLKIQTADASNYKSKIASKGTTWVIFTNPVSCGHCDNVKSVMSKVLSKINSNKVSSMLQINLKSTDGTLHGNSNSENMDLMYSLMKKFNINGGQYPFAVKFVDGKPVKFVTGLDKGTKAENIKYLTNLFNS